MMDSFLFLTFTLFYSRCCQDITVRAAKDFLLLKFCDISFSKLVNVKRKIRFLDKLDKK